MTTYEQWKKDNWDRAHRESDLSALTGTGLGGHLAALGTADLLSSDTTVLCIGVGVGTWVAETAEVAREVWALDCSPVAGARMPLGVRFVTDPRELPSDHFDLAMSLWVAPHMTNLDLLTQLTEVIRSLGPGGILAMHYKEPLHGGDVIDNREGAEDEFRLASAAGMIRRRSYFDELVRYAGGRVLRITAENPSIYYQVIEVAAHITKGTDS